MKRLSALVLAAVAAAIGWFALQQMQRGGFAGFNLPLGTASQTSLAPPPPRGNETIRVASFNIQVFGESKLSDQPTMDAIVAILQNFDLIAIQEVRAVSQDVLPRLINQLNASGKYQYDYAIGPRLGRTSSKEQYAFVFDLATIEIERNQLYTVQDPGDRLHREPLVGWFRARGPAPEQAFTFTVADVHTDPDEVEFELGALAEAFYSIRDDGRREDDVIMLGDFNARESDLRQLGQIEGLVRVVTGATPTNTLHTAQYDNILFHSAATSEFTGRGGVYDFMRDFNLTQEQAERVSDHLPIWAEFSVYEGGRPGPIAARSNSGAGF
jgi:deoxyribonuclease-1-like protein